MRHITGNLRFGDGSAIKASLRRFSLIMLVFFIMSMMNPKELIRFLLISKGNSKKILCRPFSYSNLRFRPVRTQNKWLYGPKDLKALKQINSE